MTKASSTNFSSKLLHFCWRNLCDWERLKATIFPCFTAASSGLNLCVTHSPCHSASSLSPCSFQPPDGWEKTTWGGSCCWGRSLQWAQNTRGEPPAQEGSPAVRSPCWRSLKGKCLSSSSSTRCCSQAPEVPSSWLMPFQTETCFSSYKCQTPNWWLHVAVAGVWNNSG